MVDIVFQNDDCKFSVGCFSSIHKARRELTIKRQNAVNHGYTVEKQKDRLTLSKYGRISYLYIRKGL